MEEATQIIMLARIEEDFVIERHGRTDLGERHKLRAMPRPVALTWCLAGGKDDLIKAKSYASQEGYRVFIYPPAEIDPIGRAKQDVCADHHRK